MLISLSLLACHDCGVFDLALTATTTNELEMYIRVDPEISQMTVGELILPMVGLTVVTVV